MTERSAIAVIRARLPYTVPGTLSQAWRSALHVAGTEPGQAAGARTAVSLAPTPAAVRASASARERATPARPAAMNVLPSRREARTAARTAAYSSATEDRPRCVRTGGASAVAQAATAPDTAQVHFTVALGGARVAFVVRCSGRRLDVVALCTAAHADLVRRALARVAFGLAAQGARVDAAVHEVRSA